MPTSSRPRTHGEHRPRAAGRSTGCAARNVMATTALAGQHLDAPGGEYNGAQIRLYVNGVQVAAIGGERDATSRTQPAVDRRQRAVRGALPRPIDDLRIYNRALTATEIQTDMKTPVGGAPPADTTRR